ncbi:hypothetical protein V2G26_016125 [Clonostachys chloroleuca]
MGCQVLGSAKGRHRTPAHWGVMKQPECEKRSPTSSKRIAQRRSSQTDDRVRKSTLTEQILPAGKTMCDATAQGKQAQTKQTCVVSYRTTARSKPLTLSHHTHLAHAVYTAYTPYPWASQPATGPRPQSTWLVFALARTQVAGPGWTAMTEPRLSIRTVRPALAPSGRHCRCCPTLPAHHAARTHP